MKRFVFADHRQIIPRPMGTFGTPSRFLGGGARTGFTLVEMLVAVALVVLMMSLFATIFQFATSAMAVQKGTAENDQKVRLVMTVLRGDLKHRTMKEVTPYYNGEAVLPGGDANRAGYFEIGENDPDDDTDDNLRLTVSIESPTGVVDPNDDDPYFGAARLLLYETASGLYGPGGVAAPNYPNLSNSIPPTGIPQLATGGGFYWENQPEFDDQIIGTVGYPNGAGSSTKAEVLYFLRQGTLYRRVMLIRKPEIAGSDDHTPQAASGSNLDTTIFEETPALLPPRNFYTYFDYSAYYDTTPTPPAIRFHGFSDLNNTATQFDLGQPNVRFGHNVFTGLPREFMVDGTGTWHYIGSFTQEETSYMNANGAGIAFFGYPGKVSAPGGQYPNPMDMGPPFDSRTPTPLTYDPARGKVSQYEGGVRIAEDILMTGVHRFDIKVFDDAASLGPDGGPGVANDNPATVGFDESDDDGDGTPNNASEIGWPNTDDGAFRDLGHLGMQFPLTGGPDYSFYSMNKVNLAQTPPYCPSNPNKVGTYLYRFDSWHPDVDLDRSGSGSPDPPPFRAPDVPTTSAHRPLKAIQIRITFFDQTSQQLRDVTFVQSLTEY
jgi:prepilin-type N-terminal cleavage/methylation domain-containing protein